MLRPSDVYVVHNILGELNPSEAWNYSCVHDGINQSLFINVSITFKVRGITTATQDIPECLAIQQQPPLNMRVWNGHDNRYRSFWPFELFHTFVEATAIRICGYNYQVRVSTLSFQVAQITTELADNLTITSYGITPIEPDGNSVTVG